VFVKWPQGKSPDFDEMRSDIMIGYVCFNIISFY
jgi:hypothetical protein